MWDGQWPPSSLSDTVLLQSPSSSRPLNMPSPLTPCLPLWSSLPRTLSPDLHMGPASHHIGLSKNVTISGAFLPPRPNSLPRLSLFYSPFYFLFLCHKDPNCRKTLATLPSDRYPCFSVYVTAKRTVCIFVYCLLYPLCYFQNLSFLIAGTFLPLLSLNT